METRKEEENQARLAEPAGPQTAGNLARPAEGAGGYAETAELAQAREKALEDLRWNWDGAYEISWSDGRFRAERLDGRGDVEAATAQDLRDLILADYTACPVPRQYPKNRTDEE